VINGGGIDFFPNNNATRAEAAAIFKNFLRFVVNVNDSAAAANTPASGTANNNISYGLYALLPGKEDEITATMVHPNRRFLLIRPFCYPIMVKRTRTVHVCDVYHMLKKGDAKWKIFSRTMYLKKNAGKHLFGRI
jgi:hypothetical protein